MFKKLEQLLENDETINLVVTKSDQWLTVTLASVIKEDKYDRLRPITATGSGIELDDNLLAEYEKALTKTRALLIDTNAMVASAEEAKAEAAKKAAEVKKAKDDKKNIKAGKPVAKVEETEEEDEDDDTEEEPKAEVKPNLFTDAPKATKEEPKKEEPKKIDKLTSAQRTAVDNTVKALAQATTRNDEDTTQYLMKQCIKALQAADAPLEAIEGFTKKFEAILATQIKPVLEPVTEDSPWN